MPDKPNFPPDVILRAREADARGEFKRKIVKQTPIDFTADRAELECGHSTLILPSLLKINDPTCEQCRDAWMRRQSDLQ